MSAKSSVPNRPAISVVVATRNRGARVVPTVESLLASNHPSFEVIVVDQSTDDVTQEELCGFLDDPRLHFVRTDTVGTSRSRNIGLERAMARVVAVTDDDCVVPPDWLEIFDRIFREHPRVGVAFSNVVPAEHDPEQGFVPAYFRHSNRLTRSLWRLPFTIGIGASMAMRRDVALSLGGFDPALGPGSLFPAAEEGDFAARALIRGWHIYETAEVAVVHDGFRTWDEGKTLAARDWLGTGAAWAKLLKSGHPEILSFLSYSVLIAGLGGPLTDIFRLKPPRFVRRQYYFWRGFVKALQTPVHPRTLRFLPVEDVL